MELDIPAPFMAKVLKISIFFLDPLLKVCQNFVMRSSSPKVYISVRVVLQKWKNLSKLQIAALMHTHPA